MARRSLGCTAPCLPSLGPAAPSVALAKVLKMFTQRSRDCTWSGIAKVVLKLRSGNSLVIQWLRLNIFAAEGLGLIPGQETNTTDLEAQPQNNKIPLQVRGTDSNGTRAEKAQPASQEPREGVDVRVQGPVLGRK